MKVKIQGRKRRVEIVNTSGRVVTDDGIVRYIKPKPIPPIGRLGPRDGRLPQYTEWEITRAIRARNKRVRKAWHARKKATFKRQTDIAMARVAGK